MRGARFSKKLPWHSLLLLFVYVFVPASVAHADDGDWRETIDEVVAIVREYRLEGGRNLPYSKGEQAVKAASEAIRAKYAKRLEPYTENWELLFLAASDRRLATSPKSLLVEPLAKPGVKVISKMVDLLAWEPDASVGIAKAVTVKIGPKALPIVLDLYKPKAALRVRQYAAGSVLELLFLQSRRPEESKAKRFLLNGRYRTVDIPKNVELPQLVEWTKQVASDSAPYTAKTGLVILHVLHTEKPIDGIEDIIKRSIKSTHPDVRMQAAQMQASIAPNDEATVRQIIHVATSASTSQERAAGVRLLGQLPVSEKTLDVLMACAFGEDRTAQTAAHQVLRNLRDRAKPLAPKMLTQLPKANSRNIGVILAVLRYADGEERKDVRKQAVQLMKGANAEVQRECLSFLASQPNLDDAEVQVILKSMGSNDRGTRSAALRAAQSVRHRPDVDRAIRSRQAIETDKGLKRLLDMLVAEMDQSGKQGAKP